MTFVMFNMDISGSIFEGMDKLLAELEDAGHVHQAAPADQQQPEPTPIPPARRLPQHVRHG